MSTKTQAIKWINSYWRKSRFARYYWFGWKYSKGIDMDGAYAFQCQDFANGYAADNFHFTIGGDASDWATAKLPAGWKRRKSTKFASGDILCYPYWNPRPWPNGGYYGHVMLAKNSHEAVSQNWDHPSLTKGTPPAIVRQVPTAGLVVITPKYKKG